MHAFKQSPHVAAECGTALVGRAEERDLGVVSSNVTESTGSGIALTNGTSPTIGPGVTITGGDHSVLVGQQAAGAPTVASHPVITSSLAAPSLFQSSQFAGVRIESTNAAAIAMPGATLTAAAYYGIRLQHHGVLRAGTAVTITGIKFIAGRPAGPSCSADLGGVSAAGNNVFNNTAQKNGAVGLCYSSTLPALASKSTWGCGLLPSSGCQAATGVSAPLIVTGCDQVGDYNQSAALTVALPQTCCGM